MSDISGLRFLVADDMMVMRKLVSQQLKILGAVAIEQAVDGEDAWVKMKEAAAQGKPFDFIVSDWNMPKMQGIDLLKACRADQQYKAVPFLLVTAEGEMSQVKDALTAGVDNYLLKPFTPETFKDKFMSVYRKRMPKAA
ncbi:MAG TPA: response regulator [Pseudobdellovibrionaceae bacterium]|nr:response regulator [Pseudobdellovibrionaceae bacterium]